MHIPENKIEEVRSSANIIDVVSEYVQLRKRGKNYLGLCPFHSEKTPSFTVSDEKQIYHCFGCHSGGNVFKFLMEYEKISFIEAVQELAQKLGMTLDYDEQGINEKQSEQEILYDINTEAAKYFSNNLLSDGEGEKAKEYFHKRKIKPQTLRAFGLGYAFNGWDNFVNFAKEKKIDLEKAVQLGLIGSSSDGRLYDKFSGRIIFPIFSPNGRVVAFAGRILENKENAAKYLNSPESFIYTKGRILYGLSHAKDEIRKLDKVILVEGYMDLISLYQSGIKNVVAVSGTAFTEEQVQLLSHYTKNVVLLFDADAAGIKASMRSIELLVKKNMEIRIVSLPSGEDPDSYVNKFGKEKFEELIKRAQNFFEFQTEYYQSQGMFDDPSKAADTIRDLMKPAALIKDEIKRSLLIKSISKKFNLRENLLETELEKIVARQNKVITNEERIREREKAKQISSAVEEGKTKIKPGIYNIEKNIIKLLFEGNGEIIELISNHIVPQDFLVETHQKLASLVYNSYNNKEEIIAGSLIEKADDEDLQSYILEITFDKYSISKSWEEINPGPAKEKIDLKYATDIIRNYKIIQIEQRIIDNNKRLETALNEDEKVEIMKLSRSLQKEKEEIMEGLSTKNFV